MCVKLPPEDLNLDPCPPHPTSTYTCEVTIAPPEDLNSDPYPPHPISTYTCEVTIAPRVCGG